MSARIVITTFGSFGDVFPYVGLARGLMERGHRPVIATSSYYRGALARAGVPFLPVRPDVDPGDGVTVSRIMDPRRGTEFLIRGLLLPALHDSLEDLRHATRGADLLVTHPLTFAGPLVAEERRLRWASSVLAPMSFFSEHDPPVFPVAPWLHVVARTFPSIGGLLVRLARSATRQWTEPVRELRDELVRRTIQPLRDPGEALEAAEWLATQTRGLRDRVAVTHKIHQDAFKDWYRETKRVADDRLRREQRRAEQDALDAAVDDIASVLRDLLVAIRDPDAPLVNEEARTAIAVRASELSPDVSARIIGALGEIERARRRLRLNANVVLSLETVFLALYRAFSG